MVWRLEDVRFSFLEDLTSHPIVTVIAVTPLGDLQFMSELAVAGKTLICRNVHVQGQGANTIGIANLMALAQALMEEMDFDGLDIEGAVRTTGACPGARPRHIRLARRLRRQDPANI